MMKNDVKFLKFSGTKLSWGTGSGQKAGTAVGWGTGKIFVAWEDPQSPQEKKPETASMRLEPVIRYLNSS